VALARGQTWDAPSQAVDAVGRGPFQWDAFAVQSTSHRVTHTT
jgi:hypothetical protein